MACPLFLPSSPLGGFAPDALPLGDLYGGECAVDVGALIPLDTIRGCCNHGYARVACSRAAGIKEDAYRFLIRSHASGSIDILWSSEANHHPVAVGNIQVKTSEDKPVSPVSLQASAYAAAYLRRTGQA